MRNFPVEISTARKRAGLSLVEVTEVVARSYEWLRLVECGRIPISKETAELILRTIQELVQLRKAEKESRADLFADRRLPPRLVRPK